MYKIRNVRFKNHRILGNLFLDFCDDSGKAYDTIILAGENGSGKSTILDSLYKIASESLDFELEVELGENEVLKKLIYYFENDFIHVEDGRNRTFIRSSQYKKRYNFKAIFSDVDINFESKQVSTVTSAILDFDSHTRKSDSELSTSIKQLIIDIQSQDDAQLAHEVRKRLERNEDLNEINIDSKMLRFTNAFDVMFDSLKYSRIKDNGKHKEVLFTKHGQEIDIDSLSSGEKQIVYRGCFLLRDINAMEGAYVFIDEPEISLHPLWQEKIMEYYKKIFTDTNGKQTSQIFVATHSPFIIHNDTRKNDKVIVLKTLENGSISALDNPMFYGIGNIEVVREAFNIDYFRNEVIDLGLPTVFLEGRTDEKYFKRTIEVFELNVPFQFKWIGYLDKENNERNSGSTALKQGVNFLRALKLPTKTMFLFDCDEKIENEIHNNVIIKRIALFENSKKINKGIENSLVLDDIDMDGFYAESVKTGYYGENNLIRNFKKVFACEEICKMDESVLKKVFVNLKTIIDEIYMEFQ